MGKDEWRCGTKLINIIVLLFSLFIIISPVDVRARRAFESRFLASPSFHPVCHNGGKKYTSVTVTDDPPKHRICNHHYCCRRDWCCRYLYGAGTQNFGVIGSPSIDVLTERSNVVAVRYVSRFFFFIASLQRFGSVLAYCFCRSIWPRFNWVLKFCLYETLLFRWILPHWQGWS